jgi:hypothetical protein
MSSTGYSSGIRGKGNMDDEVKYPDYVGAGHVFDQALDKIANALYAKHAEFLFGSGMAKSSKVPLGDELAWALFEEFFPKPSAVRPDEAILNKLVRKYPLEVAAEAVKNFKGGKEKLGEVVETVLFKRKRRDEVLYNLFNSICFLEGEPLVDRIFTTNFDCLFEEDSGKKWIPVGLGDDTQLRKAMWRDIPQIPVIHLHGLTGQDCIIAETEIFKMTNMPTMRVFQLALAQAEVFVFVGYSMSDPDIRTIYMQHRNDILSRKYGRNDEDTAVYVVGPPENEFDYTVGKSMWGTRGALWIPLDALSFFKKLRHFLVYKSGSQKLEDLKDRLDTKDETVLGEQIGRVARVLRVKKEDAIQFLFMARGRSGGKQ